MRHFARALLVMALAAGGSAHAQMNIDDIGPSTIPNELLDPAHELQRSQMEPALPGALMGCGQSGTESRALSPIFPLNSGSPRDLSDIRTS
jgi:hypothetical protein